MKTKVGGIYKYKPTPYDKLIGVKNLLPDNEIIEVRELDYTNGYAHVVKAGARVPRTVIVSVESLSKCYG